MAYLARDLPDSVLQVNEIIVLVPPHLQQQPVLAGPQPQQLPQFGYSVNILIGAFYVSDLVRKVGGEVLGGERKLVPDVLGVVPEEVKAVHETLLHWDCSLKGTLPHFKIILIDEILEGPGHGLSQFKVYLGVILQNVKLDDLPQLV